MAFLWGKPQEQQLNGTLIKMPAGFTGRLRSDGSTLGAVVIQGQLSHHLLSETDVQNLEPGS